MMKVAVITGASSGLGAEFLKHAVKMYPELERIYLIARREDRLRELARILDVDEIHFFNKEGKIFSGTHPEYYGYSVEDGEQIGFFRQMLEETNVVATLGANTVREWCNSRGKAGKTEGKHLQK